MSVIIPINTRIPVKIRKDDFTTRYAYQNKGWVAIYEGESKTVLDNYFLVKFDLDDIFPARKGVPIISICFDIDENGILSVYIEDKSIGQKKMITINVLLQKNLWGNWEFDVRHSWIMAC